MIIWIQWRKDEIQEIQVGNTLKYHPHLSDTHTRTHCWFTWLSLIICKPDCQPQIFSLKLSRESPPVDLQREGSMYKIEHKSLPKGPGKNQQEGTDKWVK